MAAHEHDQGKTKSQFTAVNAYLQTPPENTADSFSHDETTQTVKDWENTLPPLQARTPPASPRINTLPSIASVTGYTTQDAPLFPERRADRARSQTPLFENDRSQSLSRPNSTPSRNLPPINTITPTTAVNKPTADDVFPAILGVKTPRDAINYWHSRMGELRDIRDAKLPSPKESKCPPRDLLSQQQLSKVSKPTGIVKSRLAPKPVTRPKASATASPAEKPTPPRRRTPKARTYSDFVDTAFPTGQQTKHKRAPPSKKIESDNVGWKELPDLAPPTSTLDTNAKKLSANWHGNPIDLSGDIDLPHLHAQEVTIASNLRLSCAQYMSNKRKIFQARLQALKDGKNFTKTAAQGACSIDVNKASQLWHAFQVVGWFEEGWFEKYL